jgi:hypothetical protein
MSAACVRRPSPETPWIGAAASRAEMLGWQSPHVAGMLKWLIVDVLSSGPRIRCAEPPEEWQSEQVAAANSPPLVARPCTDAL